MEEMRWREEALCPSRAHDGQALPADLRRAAGGELTLTDAWLALAHHQEEHARVSATLLERETWLLTVILERSGPIWRHIPDHTLRFAPDRHGAPHLELGHFPHLTMLAAPGAGDSSRMEATPPRWARVSTSPESQPEAKADAPVRRCEPITVAEAVATLGLCRILTQIDLATRAAGQALLSEAQAQRDRQAHLWRTERLLGWEPEPSPGRAEGAGALHARLARALVGPAGLFAVGGAYWGLVVIAVCFLFGAPAAVLALLLGGMSLLAWFCHTSIARMVDPGQLHEAHMLDVGGGAGSARRDRQLHGSEEDCVA